MGAPDRVDIDEPPEDVQHLELELYLRVWRVLYPDAEVEPSGSRRRPDFLRL